jgi:4-hydroxythreonine-4-phosphate dehydrogenase
MLPLAITMGCPAGIGPELILKYFSSATRPDIPVVVVGDMNVLEYYAQKLHINCTLSPWTPDKNPASTKNSIPVYETSRLAKDSITPGTFSKATSVAMVDAILQSVQGIQRGIFSGMCTCPISKESLQLSGHHYPGHTEMLASLCKVKSQVMMMAGDTLKVTLATIHCAVSEIPSLLSIDVLLNLFQTTFRSLQKDFNLSHPRIAVAGLNPHAGEGGMFGDEEQRIILPAIEKAATDDIPLQGPFPPDTIFFKAARGEYDAVICMYHDQGLIPFKLLHFDDGVNVTLGLPIVRTSVDHGTAYDIAGKGVASPSSLHAAIKMAHSICTNRNKT